MTLDEKRLAVALALFAAMLAMLAWAIVERTLRAAEREAHARERVLWRKQLRALANVYTVGTPTPQAAVATREEEPEDRIARQFSEDTIEKGVAYLRDNVYANSGLAMPEPDLLRAEAITMLAGVTPSVPLGLPRD